MLDHLHEQHVDHGPSGHSHEPGHISTHEHLQGAEPAFVDEGPLSGPAESLVLDIGGDVGALVLFAELICLGLEIDLTPVGECRSHHLHTMIRRRRAVDREFVAGVYPELTSGTYVVWGVDGQPLGQVVIVGGTVSEFQAGDCRTKK
jgi:hypothetical protein